MSTTARPAWATETESSEFDGPGACSTVLIAVGDGVLSGLSTYSPVDQRAQATCASIEVSQSAFEDGRVWPAVCDVGNWEDCDARTCRDLAAALLKAAQILDSACPARESYDEIAWESFTEDHRDD